MSLFSRQYLKESDKTFVNRIIDTVVQGSAYRNRGNSALIADTTANEILSKSGVSASTLNKMVISRTNAAIQGGDDEYYAIAGKDPTRASRVSLRNIKKEKNVGIKEFLNYINPQSKIQKYKEDESIEIIAVL